MKKQTQSLLLILTCLFAAFTLGFFLGRNQASPPVSIQVPAAMQTRPQESPETSAAQEASTEAVTFPIDINLATQDEFMALPGIGEVLAGRILAYRDAHGSFTAPEELMYVEGIGEKKIEDILDLITIGGSQ